MTDPTPTRAEVARYTAAGYDPGMKASHEGAWVSFTDYQALRERAEAAEQRADSNASDAHRLAVENNALDSTLGRTLTTARRAEADAWNDAIEAAAVIPGTSPQRAHRIRALRRAAPTEDQR